MRDDNSDQHGQALETAETAWIRFADLCGFRILFVPNSVTGAKDLLKNINIAGVLLTGGGTIGEMDNGLKNRDLVEISLLRQATENELPVLGICRGMHRISALSGQLPSFHPGHTGTSHQIEGCADARTVNSFHDLSLKVAPEGYHTLWKSSDGVIEAIQSYCERTLACMWHPEREDIPNSLDLKMFQKHFTI